MLGFLYTKGIIDESRQVLNERLATFYLNNFNRQIARAQLTGSAYLIKDGILIPNTEVLRQLDPQTELPVDDTVPTGTAFVDNYKVEEQLEATRQSNQWSSEIQNDLQSRYGDTTTSYLKQLTERGFVETRC